MTTTKGKKSGKKVKIKKKIRNAHVHVQSPFNNTLVTFTDQNGDVISWSSAGVVGFKGSKKSTPYAAQMAGEDAARKAKEHGVVNVRVYVRGAGSGREAEKPVLKGERCYGPKCAIERRAQATGGPARAPKMSEYKLRLREKQKI